MRSVERKIRAFRAAFYVEPQFANWVRTRARELAKAGEAFELVMCWGRRRFRVGRLPTSDPFFALERRDGSIECSPYVGGSND
jgi:hypothetical protein